MVLLLIHKRELDSCDFITLTLQLCYFLIVAIDSKNSIKYNKNMIIVKLGNTKVKERYIC